MTNQAESRSADECRHPEARDHPGRRHPVIARDELPHPRACPRESGSCLPPDPRRRRRAEDPHEQRARRPARSGRWRAAPHRLPASLAPAPSAPQKIPNEVSITPTLNFIAFSGARASGWRIATPIAATSRTAAARSGRRQAEPVLVRAEGERDEDHLQALQQDTLEGDRERVADRIPRRAPRPPSPPRSPRDRSRPRRAWALRPAARRIALRSHWSPKTRSRPPTTRRSVSIGSEVKRRAEDRRRRRQRDASPQPHRSAPSASSGSSPRRGRSSALRPPRPRTRGRPRLRARAPARSRRQPHALQASRSLRAASCRRPRPSGSRPPKGPRASP